MGLKQTEKDTEKAKAVCKKKTLFRTFLDDFEVQQFDISERAKEELEGDKWTVISLYAVDVVLCFTIIGPLVVCFWRGTWGLYDCLLDDYLFAGDCTLSNLYALAVGLLGSLSVDLLHQRMAEAAGPPGGLGHSVLRRLYSLAWGLLDVLYWKGVWDQVDHQAGQGALQAMSTICLGLAVLLLSGTLKSALSMPVGIVVDQEEEQIHCTTALATGPKDTMAMRLLDAAASRIVELAVVLLWHGVWNTMDILAEDTEVGMGLSHTEGALGWGLLGWASAPLLLLLQPAVLELSALLSGCSLPAWAQRLIYSPLTLLGVWVTIACFRAVWYLLDSHFLPGPTGEVSLESLLGSQLLGVLGLTALHCLSCLHAGTFRDEPEEGLTVTFHLTSFHYIKNSQRKVHQTDNV